MRRVILGVCNRTINRKILKFFPAVKSAATERTEHSFLCTFMLFFNRRNKISHLLPLRVTVNWAYTFDDRQSVSFYAGAYFLFAYIYKRSYNPKCSAVVIRDRLKAPEPTAVYQIEHKRFKHIVVVMSERKNRCSEFSCAVAQCAAPHSRAQRTRIFFFFSVEHYLENIGFFDMVFYVFSFAQFGNGRKVRRLFARVSRLYNWMFDGFTVLYGLRAGFYVSRLLFVAPKDG